MRTLLFLTAFFIMPSALFSEELVKIQAHCVESSILITNSVANTGGSGVIIRKFDMIDGQKQYFAITCNHVIENDYAHICTSFKLRNNFLVSPKGRYECLVVARYPKRDLALLTFVTSDELEVAKPELNYHFQMGEVLYKSGCGLLAKPTFNYGMVSGMSQDGVVVQCNIIDGDSGCGLFTQNGGLVLIARARPVRQGVIAQGLIYSNTVQYFKEWVDKSDGGLSYILDDSKKPPTLTFLELTLVRRNGRPIERSKWLYANKFP